MTPLLNTNNTLGSKERSAVQLPVRSSFCRELILSIEVVNRNLDDDEAMDIITA